MPRLTFQKMFIDSSEAELKKAGKFKRHARYSEGHFHKKAYPHCSYAIWNSHTAPYLFPIASIFSIVIIMSSKKGSTWWLLNPHSDLLGQAIQLDFLKPKTNVLPLCFTELPIKPIPSIRLPRTLLQSQIKINHSYLFHAFE